MKRKEANCIVATVESKWTGISPLFDGFLLVMHNDGSTEQWAQQQRWLLRR